MKLLLDTHLLLWAAIGSDNLVVENDPSNKIFWIPASTGMTPK